MIGSLLIFFLILSILVLVHEAGHFWVAKKNGIWVEEFGFGIPPRIFGKKIGETIYSLNLLPFGGFVKLHGETSEEGISNPNRAFLNKSKKARFIVIIAGVVMNALLGILAFAIVYSFSGIPKDMGRVKVIDVTAATPAQVSGILVGDFVKKVDGKDVSKVDEFIKYVDEKKGKKVIFDVERNGENLRLTATPRETPPEGEGPLGVTITTTEIYYPPVWQRPFYGVYYGTKEAIFWGKTVLFGFATIIQNLFSGHVPKDLAGPVGIYAISTETVKMGILAVINFIGVLSINLAILNVLPIPALDGGRLLFIVLESIFGKKILPKVEAMAHTIGFALLLLLLLAITFYDIKRLIAAGSIAGFIQQVIK